MIRLILRPLEQVAGEWTVFTFGLANPCSRDLLSTQPSCYNKNCTICTVCFNVLKYTIRNKWYHSTTLKSILNTDELRNVLKLLFGSEWRRWGNNKYSFIQCEYRISFTFGQLSILSSNLHWYKRQGHHLVDKLLEKINYFCFPIRLNYLYPTRQYQRLPIFHRICIPMVHQSRRDMHQHQLHDVQRKSFDWSISK